MRTAEAFARGEASRDKPIMVFDWSKAAEIIKAENPTTAEAGLAGDWEWTGGVIWAENAPTDDNYTYLASTWARPQLKIDGKYIDCWRYQADSPGWDSSTKWPEEALALIDP